MQSRSDAAIQRASHRAHARRALGTQAKADGIGEINVPRIIHSIKDLPVLGTGKIDYPAVQRLAEEQFG